MLNKWKNWRNQRAEWSFIKILQNYLEAINQISRSCLNFVWLST